MNFMQVEKFIDFLDRNFKKILNTLNTYIYFKYLRKYYPIILTFLFIIYIFWSLSSSNVNLQNIQNTKYFFNFIFISFSISPIFLILSSLRFHFMKILFCINTSFGKSLDSILIASSLDAFTPAKINDFARLKNQKNKKILFSIILIERIFDLFILLFFLVINLNFLAYSVLVAFSFLGYLILNLLYIKRTFKIKEFIIFVSSVLLTSFHWQIAFYIFKNSFLSFYKLFNFDYLLIEKIITLKKFALITLISVLPISFGGFGLREVTSLNVLNNIDPSIVLGSSFAYGIAVSGSLTFIGLLYVNIRKYNF